MLQTSDSRYDCHLIAQPSTGGLRLPGTYSRVLSSGVQRSERRLELRHLEDVELNRREPLGEYLVEKGWVIEFAKKWDHQPIHVDEIAARSYPYGGIIAPTAYTMALVVMLYNQSGPRLAALGVLGYDEVRFPNPVRPGDTITVTAECVAKRESQTKPLIGIVRYVVDATNQRGETVLSCQVGAFVAKQPVSGEAILTSDAGRQDQAAR